MNNIKPQKRLHRNIFHFQITHDEIYNLLVFVLALSVSYELVKQFMGDNDILIIWIFIAAYIVLLFCRKWQERIMTIKPYERSNTFVGLYSIEESKAIEANFDNGLINREKEVEYIEKILRTIWGQQGHKRGICLVGASGCGKSTILNLLEHGKYRKINDEYDIYNFSDKYDYLEDYLKDTFKADYSLNIQKSLRNIVIILDQFERFFSLKEEKKDMIKGCIKKLSLPNVAIIFSLREEYFLQFIYTFDINYLNTENDFKSDFNGTIAHKKYFMGQNEEISNDDNILVCLGEENYFGTDHNEMLRLCEQAFNDENGYNVFTHFKDATLIQQQIVFNILENEKSYIASDRFCNWDINSMMKRYFDVQLSSTGDFFDASRIMYLLSVGHNNGISFTNDDLESALCIFTQNEKDDFHNCIEELHRLRLIKRIKHNVMGIYEVSHDYIAQSFEIYASTEMPSNVKTALDEYKSEYVRKLGIKEKIEKYIAEQKKVTVAVGIMILSYIVSIALYVLSLNGMYKHIPIVVLALSLTSLLYVYEFYRNITFHYHNGKSICAKFCYLATMICGTLAVVFPNIWLICLGIGNAIQGFTSFWIGRDKTISSVGRQMFLAYGAKTIFMGSMITICRVVLYWRNPKMDFEMIEVIIMVALLLYSYLAHMNKEFFYAHLEMLFSSDV